MSSLSTEESAALADSLRKLLQDRYDFAGARRRDLAEADGHLPGVWSQMVELGLSGLLVPEAGGGFGGGIADLQRVQRELGRALLVSPWLGSALCTRVVLLAASAAQQDAWLAELAAGQTLWALADAEHSELAGERQPTRARRTDRGWVLDGCKTPVLHAGAVQRYLVAAQLPDGQAGWFRVDASHAGVRRTTHRLVDHSWAADVHFEAAAAERLDGVSHAQVTEPLRATAIAGYCAEAQGMAETAIEMTVQFLRTRKQFGQPLGDYQALRHRVAEMYISLEQIRSAADMALEAALSEESAERQASQALLVAAEAATWILQQAIQLHGGMGMTEELPIGHYYRRMLVINGLTGGAPEALARLVNA